jgi:group I intron endonuclease
MVFSIYSVTNELDDRRYIGKTKSLPQRARRHRHAARTGAPEPLYEAMRRDGVKHFIFDVLAVCETEADALLEEAWWVKFFGSHVSIHGYNQTPTGTGRGRTVSPETRALIGAAGRGRKPSEATRAKISASNVGRKMSEEHKAKLRALHIGMKASEETKAKMRLAKLGKKRSPESVAKSAAAHVGRKNSDETKAKMSAARRAAWARKAHR